MMPTPAELGDVQTLETMLQNGFDPSIKDSNGVQALHRASMGGHVEAVQVLLAKGASVNAVNGMFAATPLVWACEDWRHTSQNGADHVEMALAACCRLAARMGGAGESPRSRGKRRPLGEAVPDSRDTINIS